MAKKDAEITVGADASAVEHAFAAVKIAGQKASESLKEGFGSAARDIVNNLADVATASGKVNLQAQHESVKSFEAATAKMAVATGADLEKMRAQFETTGLAIGKQPAEVAKWSNSVGQLTYNVGGAAEAMKGMAELAAEAGRNVDDYISFAVVLKNVGGAANDSSDMIATLHAQAEKFNVPGGMAAFTDQIKGMSELLSHFPKEKFTEITVGMANIAAHSANPQQAQRVQQQIFSTLTGDAFKLSHQLGLKMSDITDEHGQIKNPEEMVRQVVQQQIRKHGREEAKRTLMLPGYLGAEAGAIAFESYANQTVAAPHPAAITDEQRKTQGEFLEKQHATDAGKREKDEAQAAITARKMSGSHTATGWISDKLGHLASEHPLLTTIGQTGAAGALGMFMTKFSKSASGIIAKGAGKAMSGFYDVVGSKAAPAVGEQLGMFGGEGAAAASAAKGALSTTPIGLALSALTMNPQGDISVEAEHRKKLAAGLEKKNFWTGYEDITDPKEQKKAAAEYAKANGGGGITQAGADMIGKSVGKEVKDALTLTAAPGVDNPVSLTNKSSHTKAAGSHHG